MEGIINVLKPPGMTSHDVVSYARRLLSVKRIGHGGTLDPAAAGVLPLFIGKATKAVEFFEHDDKEYIGEIRLGITTDTGDSQGDILHINEVNVDRLSMEDIMKGFVGYINQIPPMYSAVHHKGKRLYELAREGITVERKPRTVEIKDINLLGFNGNTALFKVTCSKGTYIRTLCEDIGKLAGCGACLSSLIRTRSGPFGISSSYTLEELSQYANEKIEHIMLPVDRVLFDMPPVEISLQNRSQFGKGQVFTVEFGSVENKPGDLVRLYNKNDFLGIAMVTELGTCVQVVKSFIRTDIL